MKLKKDNNNNNNRSKLPTVDSNVSRLTNKKEANSHIFCCNNSKLTKCCCVLGSETAFRINSDQSATKKFF